MTAYSCSNITQIIDSNNRFSEVILSTAAQIRAGLTLEMTRNITQAGFHAVIPDHFYSYYFPHCTRS